MKKTEGAIAIHRGDILWIACDPSLGAEPKKVRTCVVVSNDVANEFGQVVTVVPTQRFTKERAARAYMADMTGARSTLKEARVANASMVMSYDKNRVVDHAGKVSASTMKAIDEALSIHLALAT